MFNLFIQDKGYCRCFAIDERISGQIDFSEKLELFRQYCFNTFYGKKMSEKEITGTYMFTLMNSEKHIFEQSIAFEGIFLKMKLCCEKAQEELTVRQIFIEEMEQKITETILKKEETKITPAGTDEASQEQQKKHMDPFIAACSNIDHSLLYCPVEKIDSLKYSMLGTSREKGLFYYMDSVNNSVKVIDRMNDARKDEMSVDTELEAILWLLGFEQEDMRILKQEKDIMIHLTDIAEKCKDKNVLKTICLMNKKNLLDSLSKNPAFELNI